MNSRRSWIALLCIMFGLAGVARGQALFHASLDALPAGATVTGKWQAVADPDDAAKQCLSANAVGDIRTLNIPAELPAAFKLELRVRYQTPYPGLASDAGPDGGHFPHWSINLGGDAGFTVDDNTVFNGLIVTAGKGKEQRVDGTRPQKQWMQYAFIKHDGVLDIQIDGMLVQTAKVPEGLLAGIAFTAMHEQLWLADLQVTAYTPPAAVVAPPTNPDFLLREDLAGGRLQNAWRAVGTWQVVADPDHPGKRVLYTNPRGQYQAQFCTLNQSFGDYELRFRVKMDTPYKGWPTNDGKHYPNWGVLLNHHAEGGGETVAQDQFVWNEMGFSDAGHESGSHERVITRGQWMDVRVVCAGAEYQWYVNGKLITHAEGSVPRSGAIGFQAMDCALWIGDIQATAYPRAMIYATFGDAPDAAKLSLAAGDEIVVAAPDNRALRLGHELIGHVAAAEYVLSFKWKPQGAIAPWSLLLGRDSEGNDIGIAIDPAAGTASLAIERDGKSTPGAAIAVDATAAALLKSTDWASYRVVRIGKDVTLSIDGKRLLSSALASPDAAGFTIRQHGGTALVDDVLMQPLPEPYVRIDPVQAHSIYTVSDAKGIDVHLRNNDTEAHQVAIAYRVVNAKGDAVDQGQSEVAVPAGAESPLQSLRFKLDAPVNAKAELTLKTDGRVFKQQTIVVTVLSDLPKFSPAYQPLIGLNVGTGNIGIAYRAGAMWMRTSAVIDGVRKTATGYDCAAGEATLKQQQAIAPGARFMNSHMGDNNVTSLLGEADNFAELVGAASQHFAGRINYYEIWNEPNHGAFWRQAHHGGDYAVVLKETYNAIKRNDRNAIVIGGVTSGTDLGFIRQIFEAGGGAYMDWLCYHPYGYPKPPEDLIIQDVTKAKAVNDEFGGWTDHFISEHGYVTTKNSMGVDEPTQARYIARTHLLASTLPYMRAMVFYRLEDGGANDQDPEARFGELHPDGSPKPAYLATANVARQLANTEYLGRLPLGDGVYALVYRGYSGDLLIALWALQPQTVALNVGDGVVGTVTDLLAENTVPVVAENAQLKLAAGESPLFIRLSSGGNDLAQTAMQATVQADAASFAEGMKQVKDAAAAQTIASAGRPSHAGAGAAAIPGRIVDAILDAYSHGALTREQAAMLAERAYFLAAVVFKDTAPKNVDPQHTDAAIAATADVIKSKCTGDQSLVFTERMLRKAMDVRDQAAALRQEHSDLAPAFAATADLLANLAQRFAAIEPVFDRGTMLLAGPKILTVAPGTHAALPVRLTAGNTPFTGQLELRFPDSWQKPPLQQSKALAAASLWNQKFQFDVPLDVSAGTQTLRLSGRQDDQLIEQQTIQLKIGRPMQAHFEPLTTPIGLAHQLVLVLDNRQTQPFDGTVELSDPSGKALPALPVHVNAKSSAKFPVPLNYDQSAPFNEYAFGFKLRAPGGAVVMNDVVPVDFTIVSQGTATVDGDLSDWSKAYPAHMRFTSEDIDPALLSARMFAMYDDKYLYVAVEVHDIIHHQELTGANIWQNDCVQMSIDPADAKSEGGYGPNDYEFGFATNTAGDKQLATEFVGADPTVLDRTLHMVKRDEANKLTKYEVAIPRAALAATFATGSKIGLDAAVNDSDHGLSREHILEFTGGVASSKNPSLYADWVVMPAK